ncbi:unnamed protein product [Dracunculus medinensis]|uniref:Neur_chan_LBD domain-containing protein n=1 Tax=Dracunculus medinensis TaxID=318479 RepID=A0A0N4UQ36_DRAME|nr:unnamed protein product [Dracunculus medinensis]
MDRVQTSVVLFDFHLEECSTLDFGECIMRCIIYKANYKRHRPELLQNDIRSFIRSSITMIIGSSRVTYGYIKSMDLNTAVDLSRT